MAKCCVVFVAVTQIICRLMIILFESAINVRTQLISIISLPFLFAMAMVVCIEFLLFKKMGPKIMNYSKLIDIILLLFFSAEWIITTVNSLTRVTDTVPPRMPISAVFTFTGFAWRTIFLLFLVQGWKLLILPPTITMGLVIGFAIKYSVTEPIFILLRGVPQTFYTIMMLYFLDKIKWSEIITNAQQERWIKINDFVLNNIPENILILELGGEVNFVSDYCKAFMRKVHVSQNPRELFTNIRDLYLQPETEPSSPSNTSRQTERMATSHILIEPTGNTFPNNNQEKIDDLDELIRTFKIIVKENNLQERQFLIYNGKLKVEEHHQKSIEIKISYIQQHNKEYIILIIRDTTQRDILIALEDNNKYKDQLLASVSHELRAPLNGNINLVESAIQAVGVADNVKERLLTPALRSSKFLLHLINDILDMSQIKAQKLRLIFKTVRLEQTLDDVLQLIELQAKKKGVEVSMAIHPDVRGDLCTDHVRLSQIVLNLLNNAIKFTKQGTVILSAMPTEDPKCLKISVQDSGIGMSKDDTKKLFSDYTHIEFAERADINPTGVGLGLSIAYSLAKLLGPKGHRGIKVESVIGIGSTFSFWVENKEESINLQDIAIKKGSDKSQQSQGVPDEIQVSEPRIFSRLHKSFSANLMMQANERLLPSDSPRANLNAKCTCAKILVVDDNPFNTMAFEAVLGSLNQKCDSVFDGRSAIERIMYRQKTFCGENCRQYNVVFMDQEMPGMTGSETVEEIKKLQFQGLVPQMRIIGCTAHGSAEEIEKFMESGIDMCIHKPITMTELQKILIDQNSP